MVYYETSSFWDRDEFYTQNRGGIGTLIQSLVENITSISNENNAPSESDKDYKKIQIKEITASGIKKDDNEIRVQGIKLDRESFVKITTNEDKGGCNC